MPKPRVRYWSELTAAEIRAAAETSVLILPIAATEQHGPRLATGTDQYLNELLQRGLVKTPPPRGQFLILPTLAIGSSDHHVPFGGTLTLPPILYTQVLVALLRTLLRQGHRRIFLLNSHGGNYAPLLTALSELATECTELNALVGGACYWTLCEAAWKREVTDLEMARVGHACEIETSLLAVARPDLPSHPAPPGVPYPAHLEAGWAAAANFAAMTAEGHLGFPAAASARKGRKLFALAVRELRTFFADFSERPLPADLRR